METMRTAETEHAQIVHQVEPQMTEHAMDHIQVHQAETTAQLHMVTCQAEQYVQVVQQQAQSAMDNQKNVAAAS